MTPEDFADFIETVIKEEVTTGPTCFCGCGETPIEGVKDAVSRIAAALEGVVPPGSIVRCGRCAAPTPVQKINETGPYRTCPDCTEIIRN